MFKPGTIVYGISSDKDDLAYAGDQCIALIIQSEQDGAVDIFYIQSIFAQAHASSVEAFEEGAKDYGLFSPKYQEQIRIYLRFPTKENAQKLRALADNPYLCYTLTYGFDDFAPLELTPDGFKKMEEAQHSVMHTDEYTEYMNHDIELTMGIIFDESHLQTYDFKSFANTFLTHSLFQNIPSSISFKEE